MRSSEGESPADDERLGGASGATMLPFSRRTFASVAFAKSESSVFTVGEHVLAISIATTFI